MSLSLSFFVKNQLTDVRESECLVTVITQGSDAELSLTQVGIFTDENSVVLCNRLKMSKYWCSLYNSGRYFSYKY